MSNCVVCDAEIEPGGERWANSWEAARKRFPCHAGCVASFDPDVHWVPSHAPEPASAEDELRLLAVMKRRLRDGDEPIVITHEMLQAGVGMPGIRKALIEALAAGSQARQDAATLSVFGALSSLLGGNFIFGHNRDKRKPASIEDALADVARWEARFART